MNAPPVSSAPGPSIAERVVMQLASQEAGRQQAFSNMTASQDRNTAVLSSMLQVIQNRQEMSMRELRVSAPEAHQILDSDRKQEKQRRKRQEARAAKTRPAAEDAPSKAKPETKASAKPPAATMPPRTQRATSAPIMVPHPDPAPQRATSAPIMAPPPNPPPQRATTTATAPPASGRSERGQHDSHSPRTRRSYSERPRARTRSHTRRPVILKPPGTASSREQSRSGDRASGRRPIGLREAGSLDDAIRRGR